MPLPKPSLPRTPLCLGLILASSVSVDPGTGVVSIIGPYWRFEVESFPVTYLSLEVYVVLTECAGNVLVELRLVDAEDAKPPVFRQFLSAHFEEPLTVKELIFRDFSSNSDPNWAWRA